jgi:type IV pilus assembly protein PilO
MNRNVEWAKLKQPQIAMRVLIGTLLAANLAMAIVAFKPFGGSADDLRRQADKLRQALAAAQARVAIDRRLAQKVETARQDGDAFLAKYVTEWHIVSSTVYEELLHITTESGVQAGQSSTQYDDIAGSDTIKMMTITAGYEGTYQQISKFVNLVDRSPRFFVIDSMQVSAPQQNGQKLTVQFKIKTFVRAAASGPGADS